MKKALLIITSLFFALGIQAQGKDNPIAVGDIIIIQEPAGPTFKHIHFPRKNFIIKRGGIADMGRVYGCKVVVSDMMTKDNNNTQVTLKRKDGRKFFRFLPSVKADLENALQAGELKIASPKESAP
ncbi:hypothetical protein WIW50_08295 [Flavobacteriaceae bacterium 3-367]|uniref:hypothetical protein n=1 Tax=Eudoraea algarum TaxID=3417568 RepID=UPI00327B554E